MTVIRLIKLLEDALREHGNKQVLLYDRRGDGVSTPKVEVCTVMKSSGYTRDKLFFTEK